MILFYLNIVKEEVLKSISSSDEATRRPQTNKQFKSSKILNHLDASNQNKRHENVHEAIALHNYAKRRRCDSSDESENKIR